MYIAASSTLLRAGTTTEPLYIAASSSLLHSNTGDWAGTWQSHSPSYFQIAGSYLTNLLGGLNGIFGNSTTTNATTTSLAITGLTNTFLAVNANGSVIATTTPSGSTYFTTSGATTTLVTGSVLQSTTASSSNICLSGVCNTSWPSGTLSGGTTNLLAAWTSSSALTGTSSPTVASINTSSTTATSTFTNLLVTGIADLQNAIIGPITFPTNSWTIIPMIASTQASTTNATTTNATITNLTVTNLTTTIKQYPSFTFSTSTFSGTTTQMLGVAMVAETWNSAICFTSIGTTTVQFVNGSSNMNSIVATTTSYTNNVNLTTNNVFTALTPRYVNIGSPTASSTSVTCTISKSISSN